MSEVDQTITCRDCRQPFIFAAGEAKFFEEKGFKPPSRCKPCRQAKKAAQQYNEDGK